MAHLTISPAHSLRGELSLPGDKSISHRALLLGAVSQGTTRIDHCLESEDNESTRRALRALGIRIQEEAERVVIEGRGLYGFKTPSSPLEMGNSGTTTRLLLGLLAGQSFSATLSGDASLSQRPMRRVTEPLGKMGADIQGPDGADHLPLTVRGGGLHGILYTLPVPSAQVKSALLLAALYAKEPTTVVEPIPTRDHTERMLEHFGAQIKREGPEITLVPGPELKGKDLTIPGDISSAAFFLAAAAIVPGSSVTVRQVGLNPTRTGFLEMLKQMGANVKSEIASLPLVARNDLELRNGAVSSNRSHDVDSWEPVGDVTVSHAPLKGIRVGPAAIPGLIDELPILMVAATQAQGITLIQGAGELRVKEADRIVSMATGLTAMGAKIQAEGDEIRIEGPVPLKGARVKSFNDHRTAMALAVAGLAAKGQTTIEGAEWIDISFPEFVEILESIRR
ncbi:MAG: 3-phosphoshikimate 1-carboxyvinyltransferase [Candidatus Omnitrophica bacterium]|nr:3-phosphoshikimate 1-carboxyvinyltransferase [Candidatus Omnitrophota bacterium]